MSEQPRIGVFICHCGVNIEGVVDVKRVAEAVKELDNVVFSTTYEYMCSDPGQDLIKNAVKEHNLNRVVVAACSPRMHEETFRSVCADAGLNPYLFEMANIREHDSWVHTDREEATKKAIALVASAVRKANFLAPLEKKEKDVTKAVLIIGGGIAGIQAALEIADAGYTVYIVEREPSIGGHMIQLDKTFPTLDCSACILTPKMSSVGRHENITLLTYSEVESVEGSAGAFKVRVRRKSRFIDEEKCIGCLQCVAKCPVKVESEFDYGLAKRKAVYTPFPQAVPNIPVIDSYNCRQLTGKKCGVCAKVCPTDAVNYDMKDETVELEVGFIIVATGYDLMNLSAVPQYGYGTYDEVYHSLQFERLLNASGPTSGRIVKKDGTEPKSIALLHCIGSRDENFYKYCSRVCCMYALKFSHIIKERLGEDVEVYQCYIDMRCFGKGYEEFYKRLSEEGVNFIRGKVAKVTDEATEPEEEGKLILVVEDTLIGKMLRLAVDMVVLCPAMVPSAGTGELANILKVSRSEDGFFLERHPKLDPVATLTDGIYICGCAQSPKDIPDTVAQASAAAARILTFLKLGKVPIEPFIAVIDEEVCTGCRVCNILCPFDAISYDEEKNISKVDEALCKGCGVCVSACPFGAIENKQFTDEQLMAQIEGALR